MVKSAALLPDSTASVSICMDIINEMPMMKPIDMGVRNCHQPRSEQGANTTSMVRGLVLEAHRTTAHTTTHTYSKQHHGASNRKGNHQQCFPHCCKVVGLATMHHHSNRVSEASGMHRQHIQTQYLGEGVTNHCHGADDEAKAHDLNDDPNDLYDLVVVCQQCAPVSHGSSSCTLAVTTCQGYL